jgi:toxin-antitoxin system PIN domain toxin
VLLTDVNVLLGAALTASPFHRPARQWLEGALAGREPVGVPSTVASGFLRIATNRRALVEPLEPDEAWGFLSAVMGAPIVQVVNPGPQHWATFRALCAEFTPRGNDITDVYLAALAIEMRGTWVSFDRGFARFPDLRWLLPS